MNLLLDTHSFLWYIWDDPRITETVATAIEDEENGIFLSIVSLWEITIKSSLGKLAIELPLADFVHKHVDGNGFRVLPIAYSHLFELHTLPFHHRDPFDRVLIAQCRCEKMTFVSADTEVAKYAVPRLWD